MEAQSGDRSEEKEEIPEKKSETRRNDRICRIVASVLAVIMIAGLAVYGIYWNIEAESRLAKGQISYYRAFSDILGYLEDTEGYLLKAMASGTPERTSLMLEEAWRSAALAENSLSVMPIDRSVMEDISKYLVQVGDVVKSYNAGTVGGTAMSEENAETLSRLYGYAQDLRGAFAYMAYNIGQGGCTWEEIEKYSKAITENEEIAEEYSFLENFSAPFADYPSLIYDGPFSEHMKTRKAKALEGSKTITAEQGSAFLRRVFADCEPDSIRYSHESTDGVIETYSYVIKVKDPSGDGDDRGLITAYADVTKQGGLLYSMVFYRAVQEVNLDAGQAVEAGRRFLERIGYEDMVPSYYTIEGGYVTANYCTEKENVLYYPDMVKVSIALDNGEVVGLEGERYIRSHTERDPDGEILSEEEARATVGKQLEVISARRAVIPNDFGGEYNTYEFTCDFDGRRVLVYVDCKTGAEREILILQEDETGILAK